MVHIPFDMNFNILARHLGFSNLAAVKFDQIRHFLKKKLKIISFLVIKSAILVDRIRSRSYMIVVTHGNFNILGSKRSESQVT